VALLGARDLRLAVASSGDVARDGIGEKMPSPARARLTEGPLTCALVKSILEDAESTVPG